ncbi:MAG: CoA transferase [Chloroflexi bacterium]|nr:CoA transferase [Chloroflexota bacterium]
MADPAKPLDGIRVLAQGIVWAGPFSTMILADLGAEVIEIESIQHLNPTRTNFRHIPQELLDGRAGASYLNRDGSEGFWNRQAWFNYAKRGCKSVTLDLRSERGHELFLDLVRHSDAYIENNAADVVDNLGIGYEVLQEVNPQLIMVRFPGFGIEGPYRDFKGYGANMEAVAGHTGVRGYLDSDPSDTPASLHGDPTSGAQVAFALQAALFSRDRTGEGQLVEISQFEAVASHVGHAFMDYQMNGRVQGHAGNHHPSMAPYGAFPCSGDDRWITIAIPSDEAFTKLCAEMGRPELAEDERFADTAVRHRNRDAINAEVAAWTVAFEDHALMLQLQAAGVPAIATTHHEEITSDPHHVARGYFQAIEQHEAGTHLFPGPMARFERTSLLPARPAPTLGRHNEEILRGVVGLSAEEYQQLLDDDVIGTVYLENATA